MSKLDEDDYFDLQSEDCIVHIHQLHLHPIERGKAQAKTKYRKKSTISLLDSYARVDKKYLT
jgi:hypothetical protein